MSMEIKTNVTALVAQRQLGRNSDDMKKSVEKLSSGLRINRSADDAAGLAVSERIKAKIKSLDVAKRNANDAGSYIQTAEGGLSEISNMVVRMRELTSQAASDTLGNRERSFLNKEFQELRQEVDRIRQITEFNGAKLLSGESFDEPLQLFIGATNRGKDILGNAPEIDEENDPDVLHINLSELKEMSDSLDELVKNELSLVPSDSDGGARDLGESGTEDLFARLDNAMNSVSAFRATLGAVQSRLNSAINNIDLSSENLNAAQSRILDVDYAQETAKFAQSRIMVQAGLAVQAHANNIPEMALTLLRI